MIMQPLMVTRVQVNVVVHIAMNWDHNCQGCEACKLVERRVASESASIENILQSQTMTKCTVDLLSSCIQSPPATSTSQPGIHHH